MFLSCFCLVCKSVKELQTDVESVCKYILLHTAVFVDDWRLNGGGVVLRLLKLWLSAKPLYLPHSATYRPAASHGRSFQKSQQFDLL